MNGYAQAAGGDHAALILNRLESPGRDTFAIDIAACYPTEAGLDSLRREFALDRGAPGQATITDEVTFRDDAPGREYESVLVSYYSMEAAGNQVRVCGDRERSKIEIEPSASTTVEQFHDAVEIAGLSTGDEEYRNVWRTGAIPDGTDNSSPLTVEHRCDFFG